jgi:flagellar hook-associated protein 3 FlgL
MQTTLSPSSALFLANVNRVQQRLAAANNQITSGRKVTVASDAPDQIDSLLQMRADRMRNQQIQSNLSVAQTDAQAADSALSATLNIFDRAIQLAAEGATVTQTAQTRNALAQEVAALQSQVVSYSQTQVQGRYIFSGDTDGKQYYQLHLLPPPDPTAVPTGPVDPASFTGVDRLLTCGATMEIEDPAGGSFSAGKTAHEIYDTTNPDGTHAADNVFAALNTIRIALLNNDQAAVTSSVDSLQQASTHLNNMQAFYGTVQNRIQDANAFADRYDMQLQTEIAGIQDADITSAALELTQAATQLQAAFQTQAKMSNRTLFDYLG